MPEAMLESMNAPLYPGAATLVVRDLAAVARYHEEILGFERIEARPGSLRLGAGGVTLLTLRHEPNATLAPGGAAGLFHIAYLVPSRADLAGWLAHAGARGLRLDGQADHLVSEALYLSDPEGNGIEVYRDRPRAEWQWGAEGVAMANIRMDIPAMIAEGAAGGERGRRLPAGTRIGHMHLKVGDLAAAEAFYVGALGLEVTRRRADGACFMATGKYHHHIAVNTWRSAGAGRRAAGMTGLADYEMVARDAATFEATAARLLAAGGRRDGAAIEAADAWGNAVRLVRR